MSQVIVYTNSNGGVSVCYPTGELSIEEVKAKDTPEHSIIVEDEDLPTIHDDLFDAWELIDGVIVVNHGKATSITKDRLRRERKPLLEAEPYLINDARSGTWATLYDRAVKNISDADQGGEYSGIPLQMKLTSR